MDHNNCGIIFIIYLISHFYLHEEIRESQITIRRLFCKQSEEGFGKTECWVASHALMSNMWSFLRDWKTQVQSLSPAVLGCAANFCTCASLDFEPPRLTIPAIFKKHTFIIQILIRLEEFLFVLISQFFCKVPLPIDSSPIYVL